jgi:hypothetical protein
LNIDRPWDVVESAPVNGIDTLDMKGIFPSMKNAFILCGAR